MYECMYVIDWSPCPTLEIQLIAFGASGTSTDPPPLISGDGLVLSTVSPQILSKQK